MKKQILITGITAVLIFLSANAGFGQDKPGKKMGMKGDHKKMAKMMNSPEHRLMMAYRQNFANFAKTLYGAARKSDKLDAGFARASFAEMKRSMEKMEAIHKEHMSKMSPEMRKKMADMMKKMQKENDRMKSHMLALGSAVASSTPDASTIEAHTAAIISRMSMQRMGMQMKGMKMNSMKNGTMKKGVHKKHKAKTEVKKK